MSRFLFPLLFAAILMNVGTYLASGASLPLNLTIPSATVTSLSYRETPVSSASPDSTKTATTTTTTTTTVTGVNKAANNNVLEAPLNGSQTPRSLRRRSAGNSPGSGPQPQSVPGAAIGPAASDRSPNNDSAQSSRRQLQRLRSTNLVVRPGGYAEFLCEGLSEVRWLAVRPLISPHLCSLPVTDGAVFNDPEPTCQVDPLRYLTIWKHLVLHASVSRAVKEDSGTYVCADRMGSEPLAVTLGFLDDGPVLSAGPPQCADPSVDNFEMSCSFDYSGDPSIPVVIEWIDTEDGSVVKQLVGQPTGAGVDHFTLPLSIGGGARPPSAIPTIVVIPSQPGGTQTTVPPETARSLLPGTETTVKRDSGTTPGVSTDHGRTVDIQTLSATDSTQTVVSGETESLGPVKISETFTSAAETTLNATAEMRTGTSETVTASAGTETLATQYSARPTETAVTTGGSQTSDSETVGLETGSVVTAGVSITEYTGWSQSGPLVTVPSETLSTVSETGTLHSNYTQGTMVSISLEDNRTAETMSGTEFSSSAGTILVETGSATEAETTGTSETMGFSLEYIGSSESGPAVTEPSETWTHGVETQSTVYETGTTYSSETKETMVSISLQDTQTAETMTEAEFSSSAGTIIVETGSVTEAETTGTSETMGVSLEYIGSSESGPAVTEPSETWPHGVETLSIVSETGTLYSNYTQGTMVSISLEDTRTAETMTDAEFSLSAGTIIVETEGTTETEIAGTKTSETIGVSVEYTGSSETGPLNTGPSETWSHTVEMLTETETTYSSDTQKAMASVSSETTQTAETEVSASSTIRGTRIVETGTAMETETFITKTAETTGVSVESAEYTGSRETVTYVSSETESPATGSATAAHKPEATLSSGTKPGSETPPAPTGTSETGTRWDDTATATSGDIATGTAGTETERETRESRTSGYQATGTVLTATMPFSRSEEVSETVITAPDFTGSQPTGITENPSRATGTVRETETMSAETETSSVPPINTGTGETFAVSTVRALSASSDYSATNTPGTEQEVRSTYATGISAASSAVSLENTATVETVSGSATEISTATPAYSAMWTARTEPVSAVQGTTTSAQSQTGTELLVSRISVEYSTHSRSESSETEPTAATITHHSKSLETTGFSVVNTGTIETHHIVSAESTVIADVTGRTDHATVETRSANETETSFVTRASVAFSETAASSTSSVTETVLPGTETVSETHKSETHGGTLSTGGTGTAGVISETVGNSTPAATGTVTERWSSTGVSSVTSRRSLISSSKETVASLKSDMTSTSANQTVTFLQSEAASAATERTARVQSDGTGMMSMIVTSTPIAESVSSESAASRSIAESTSSEYGSIASEQTTESVATAVLKTSESIESMTRRETAGVESSETGTVDIKHSYSATTHETLSSAVASAGQVTAGGETKTFETETVRTTSETSATFSSIEPQTMFVSAPITAPVETAAVVSFATQLSGRSESARPGVMSVTIPVSETRSSETETESGSATNIASSESVSGSSGSSSYENSTFTEVLSETLSLGISETAIHKTGTTLSTGTAARSETRGTKITSNTVVTVDTLISGKPVSGTESKLETAIVSTKMSPSNTETEPEVGESKATSLSGTNEVTKYASATNVPQGQVGSSTVAMTSKTRRTSARTSPEIIATAVTSPTVASSLMHSRSDGVYWPTTVSVILSKVSESSGNTSTEGEVEQATKYNTTTKLTSTGQEAFSRTPGSDGATIVHLNVTGIVSAASASHVDINDQPAAVTSVNMTGVRGDFVTETIPIDRSQTQETLDSDGSSFRHFLRDREAALVTELEMLRRMLNVIRERRRKAQQRAAANGTLHEQQHQQQQDESSVENQQNWHLQPNADDDSEIVGNDFDMDATVEDDNATHNVDGNQTEMSRNSTRYPRRLVRKRDTVFLSEMELLKRLLKAIRERRRKTQQAAAGNGTADVDEHDEELDESFVSRESTGSEQNLDGQETDDVVRTADFVTDYSGTEFSASALLEVSGMTADAMSLSEFKTMYSSSSKLTEAVVEEATGSTAILQPDLMAENGTSDTSTSGTRQTSGTNVGDLTARATYMLSALAFETAASSASASEATLEVTNRTTTKATSGSKATNTTTAEPHFTQLISTAWQGSTVGSDRTTSRLKTTADVATLAVSVETSGTNARKSVTAADSTVSPSSFFDDVSRSGTASGIVPTETGTRVDSKTLQTSKFAAKTTTMVDATDVKSTLIGPSSTATGILAASSASFALSEAATETSVERNVTETVGSWTPITETWRTASKTLRSTAAARTAGTTLAGTVDFTDSTSAAWQSVGSDKTETSLATVTHSDIQRVSETSALGTGSELVMSTVNTQRTEGSSETRETTFDRETSIATTGSAAKITETSALAVESTIMEILPTGTSITRNVETEGVAHETMTSLHVAEASETSRLQASVVGTFETSGTVTIDTTGGSLVTEHTKTESAFETETSSDLKSANGSVEYQVTTTGSSLTTESTLGEKESTTVETRSETGTETSETPGTGETRESVTSSASAATVRTETAAKETMSAGSATRFASSLTESLSEIRETVTLESETVVTVTFGSVETTGFTGVSVPFSSVSVGTASELNETFQTGTIVVGTSGVSSGTGETLESLTDTVSVGTDVTETAKNVTSSAESAASFTSSVAETRSEIDKTVTLESETVAIGTVTFSSGETTGVTGVSVPFSSVSVGTASELNETFQTGTIVVGTSGVTPITGETLESLTGTVSVGTDVTETAKNVTSSAESAASFTSSVAETLSEIDKTVTLESETVAIGTVTFSSGETTGVTGVSVPFSSVSVVTASELNETFQTGTIDMGTSGVSSGTGETLESLTDTVSVGTDMTETVSKIHETETLESETVAIGTVTFSSGEASDQSVSDVTEASAAAFSESFGSVSEQTETETSERQTGTVSLDTGTGFTASQLEISSQSAAVTITEARETGITEIETETDSATSFTYRSSGTGETGKTETETETEASRTVLLVTEEIVTGSTENVSAATSETETTWENTPVDMTSETFGSVSLEISAETVATETSETFSEVQSPAESMATGSYATAAAVSEASVTEITDSTTPATETGNTFTDEFSSFTSHETGTNTQDVETASRATETVEIEGTETEASSATSVSGTLVSETIYSSTQEIETETEITPETEPSGTYASDTEISATGSESFGSFWSHGTATVSETLQSTETVRPSVEIYTGATTGTSFTAEITVTDVTDATRLYTEAGSTGGATELTETVLRSTGLSETETSSQTRETKTTAAITATTREETGTHTRETVTPATGETRETRTEVQPSAGVSTQAGTVVSETISGTHGGSITTASSTPRRIPTGTTTEQFRGFGDRGRRYMCRVRFGDPTAGRREYRLVGAAPALQACATVVPCDIGSIKRPKSCSPTSPSSKLTSTPAAQQQHGPSRPRIPLPAAAAHVEQSKHSVKRQSNVLALIVCLAIQAAVFLKHF